MPLIRFNFHKGGSSKFHIRALQEISRAYMTARLRETGFLAPGKVASYVHVELQFLDTENLPDMGYETSFSSRGYKRDGIPRGVHFAHIKYRHLERWDMKNIQVCSRELRYIYELCKSIEGKKYSYGGALNLWDIPDRYTCAKAVSYVFNQVPVFLYPDPLYKRIVKLTAG